MCKQTMASTISDTTQINEKFNNLQISYTNENAKDRNNECPEYGLPLKDVFKLAIHFYKEKEGKALHFSYEDKLQLIAFSQQVSHGPLADAINKLPLLGALDVVGKDRRLAWQKLGNLSADEARSGFVELLSRKCHLFSTYVEAHRREKNEQERLAKEEEIKKIAEEEEQRKKDEEEKVLHEQMEKEELIKRQIQQALNEQTYEQFRKYAEHQFPGEPEKQGALVKQLQEQHYIQYMQQLQAAQRGEPIKEAAETSEKSDSQNVDENDLDESQAGGEYVMCANMWTRSDIDTFKQSVSQAEGDGVVRVGHGETVTVRVPTHQEGSRLFWEFATDHYDIGFGVYFEYGTPTTDQVSVHISESEDEENDLDEEEEEEEMDEEYDEDGNRRDLELGGDAAAMAKAAHHHHGQPPLHTEIVPVFRRDCQNEVYAGSHKYPGQGVYLLKFDNSYSLWRSKTLYYRVYYTQ